MCYAAAESWGWYAGGNTNATRFTLDFAGLVNAIHMLPGTSMTFQDMIITGIAALTSLDPQQVEDLPGLFDSAVWPSIVSDVNTTVRGCFELCTAAA